MAKQVQLPVWLTIAIVACLGSIVRSQETEQLRGAPAGKRPPPNQLQQTGDALPTRGHAAIDFASQVNEYFSRGVTTDNNAAVLLYEVLGPAPEGCRQTDEFFQALGMPPPPENGHYLRVPAELAEDLSATLEGPWRRAAHPELADWLDSEAALLRTLRAASERSQYFSPLVLPREPRTKGVQPSIISILLPGVQQSRNLARILVSRGNLACGEGQLAAGAADLVAAIRLGRLVGRGPTLIEGLVGIAIETMANSALQSALQSPAWTAADLQHMAAALDQLPPRGELADKIDQCERYLLADLAQICSAGRMPEGLEQAGAAWLLQFSSFRELDWPRISRNLNGWYDRLVAALREPDRAARDSALAALNAELAQLAEQAGTTQVNWAQLTTLYLGDKETASAQIAGVLLRLGFPAVESVVKAVDRVEQWHENLRAALALARYRADHAGRSPDVLVQLVPEYLGDLPLDLYAGRPLTYRVQADAVLLYSVGPNGRDDGGNPWNGQSDAPGDLVVRLPR